MRMIPHVSQESNGGDRGELAHASIIGPGGRDNNPLTAINAQAKVVNVFENGGETDRRFDI